MAMTAEEARELRAALAEALDPIHGWRLGNVTAAEAFPAVTDVLHRMDLALLAVVNAGGAQDPAQLRLDTMAAAVRQLCHDLRGGATALLQTAELMQRYAERGDWDRATAKARAMTALVRERTAAIAQGEGLALGEGREGR